jgi:hypothetical protein
MKRKMRTPFNEQVLRRIQERRYERRRLIIPLATLFFLILNIGASLYFTHEARKPRWPNAVLTGSAAQTKTVTTTEDGIPALLNINGETWHVVRVKQFTGPDQEISAEISCRVKVIAYLPAQTPSLLRTSLIHEIFHAGACLHGGDAWWNSINPDKNSHEGIYHLADFWAGFARSNPEFMEWISR